MSLPLTRRTMAVAVAAMVLPLAACGSSDDTPAEPAAASASIGADRCAANQDAGKITYLTSFDLGGSVAILNTITAKELGYFKDLCLDVEIRPVSDSNPQLVSAGTAQIAGAGSASEALTAISNGAKVTGVGTYGNVGQVALMTRGDEIGDLKDLAGKTLGYKVSMPNAVTAMLEEAGVDIPEVKKVSVGFDPTILTTKKVDALTGFLDNEPQVLRGMGNEITTWDPKDFGVQGTFSTTIVNTEWAEANPTAVEDFLRAAYHAFDYIQESEAHLDEAIGYSEALNETGYNAANQKARWQAGAKLVTDNLVDGHGVGYQSAELWQPEADLLEKYKIVKKPITVASAQTSKYVDAIYDGADLIWPAPGATE